jgi:hypothetical protein
MRKIIFLCIIILLFPNTLWATDPYVGTWKLNAGKSKFSPTLSAYIEMAPPREMTLVVREIGDELEIIATGKRTDNTKISIKITRPIRGGVEKFEPPPPEGMSYVDTVIEPGNWYWNVLKDGKQFYAMHSVISKDGKVMEWVIKGTDDKGVPYEHIEVFNKQ